MAEHATAGGTAWTRPGRELVAAVGFLTRVPVGPAAMAEGRTGAAAFGLVGAGLGLIAAVPVLLAGGAHPVLAAVLALVTLTILDGALHLDGLGDTVDALAAPADRAEAARADPRVGAAGAVGIILVLGVDAASLAEIAGRSPAVAAAALVVAISASRAAAPGWALASVRLRSVARGSLGSWFASSTHPLQAVVAGGTSVIVGVLAANVAGTLVAAGALVGAAIGVAVGAAVLIARGQLDGDGHGALIELTLAGMLVSTALLG